MRNSQRRTGQSLRLNKYCCGRDRDSDRFYKFAPKVDVPPDDFKVANIFVPLLSHFTAGSDEQSLSRRLGNSEIAMSFI